VLIWPTQQLQDNGVGEDDSLSLSLSLSHTHTHTHTSKTQKNGYKNHRNIRYVYE